MFDSSASLDPLTMLLLGGAAGLGQAGATSRLPISPAAAWGGLGAGLLAGQRAANQSQIEQQEATSRAAANQMALWQLGLLQGTESPSGKDLLSGKFKLNPDLNAAFGGTPAQQAQPQLPMPSAAVTAPTVGGMGVGGAMQRLTLQAAQANNIDPQFALAHIQGESNFDPMAVGPSVTGNSLHPGKPQLPPKGIAQLADDTAAQWKVDPFNPQQALNNAWGPMLRDLLDKNDGDYVKAAQAYGTIPHDLSKMDQNQTAVYQAAVAANARKQPVQVAQNTVGAPATDATSGPIVGTQMTPRQAMAAYIMRRNLVPLTPAEQAWLSSQMAPPGSVERRLGEMSAYKAAGMDTLQVTRPGGVGHQLNPETGQWGLAFQNPRLPEGTTLGVGPNGQMIAEPVPGALPGIASAAGAQASGAAAGRLPYVGSTAGAEAAGRAPYEPPVELYGPGGVPQQVPRQNLPSAFGPVASGLPPVGQPTAPQALQPNAAQLGDADFARMKAAGVPDNLINSIKQAQKAQPPEAAAAAFQMNTPLGPKPVTDVHVGDMFPMGQGIPQPPAPPPGRGFGPPTVMQHEIMKDDADRLEQYNKEQSAAQKQYQDLLHLREVLNAGFSTSKAARIGSDFANIAHGLGADWAYGTGWAPANAAEFDKASTDLVFAALKALPGQPRVSEITGLQKANPSLAIPRETNYNMMNDILSANKWQDERARLATEFTVQHPGTPLSVFDTAYNRMAPLADVTNEYKGIMRQNGALFPEETKAGGAVPGKTPSGTAALPQTATGPNGHKLYLPPGGTQWIDTVTQQPYVAPPVR